MLKNWLIQAAIAFALRQLAKWQGGIDWAKVKADLSARVRDLIPGEMFDGVAVKMVESVVDMLAAALGDQKEIDNIVNLLMAGKIPEAMLALKDLIISKFKAPGQMCDPLVDDVIACLS